MNPITKLNRLAESHGELKPGSGMISGVIALSLAILCFLAVLAFHFPAHLTTPELRKSYDVEVLRTVMFIALVIASPKSLRPPPMFEHLAASGRATPLCPRDGPTAAPATRSA